MDDKIMNDKNYNAESIKVLEGLEAVRMRPAMYIGDIGPKGLHHLVNEVVDNSIDEALAGYCNQIDVEITKEGGIRVSDNGRGIPVQIHKKQNKPAVEVVMTVLHAGGKFDKDNYKVSGGLHGVGVSCVNALSEKMITEVHKENKHYRIEFSRGKTVKELEIVGDSTKQGTVQTFYPDKEIFKDTDYKFNLIAHRLKVLAFLNKGIKITLKDLREKAEDSEEESYLEFKYDGGLAEFVEYIDENKNSLCEPICIDQEKEGIPVEIALAWNDKYQEHIESYVNNIHTLEGGTHEEGFKSGLTRAVNAYATKNNLFKNEKIKLSGSDIREGLTAVISIKVMEPQFEGQTKTKLGNGEITGVVQSLIYEYLYQFFEENPKTAKLIIEKCISSFRGREAARKAREMIRRKSVFEGGSLPGKLYDCSKGANPMDCELFVVEGDSAGGSAVDGRDNMFQAILPLKGKILNVEKSRIEKILDNEEIKNLITAIGTGVGSNDGGEGGFEYEKLRYGKIIIMTDADVDGAHISTLLLTFFFRYMPELIERGNIYVAMPPLYKAYRGKELRYIYPGADAEYQKEEAIRELGGEDGKKVEVQRYKGLGEMNPDQLKETTLDPNNRKIKQVYIDDAVEADRVFTMLMGGDVPPRRKFIIDRCKFAENIDA